MGFGSLTSAPPLPEPVLCRQTCWEEEQTKEEEEEDSAAMVMAAVVEGGMATCRWLGWWMPRLAETKVGKAEAASPC